jgi:hypothetical protein
MGMQILEKQRQTNIPFMLTTEITRPANTTIYHTNDLIAANAATTLVECAFGAWYANRVVKIKTMRVASSNGAAATKLQLFAHFFNVSTVDNGGSAVVNDHDTWSCTYAAFSAAFQCAVEAFGTTLDISTVIDLYSSASNIDRCFQLDANGKVWFAPVTINTYTPASAEKLLFIIEGEIL